METRIISLVEFALVALCLAYGPFELVLFRIRDDSIAS